MQIAQSTSDGALADMDGDGVPELWTSTNTDGTRFHVTFIGANADDDSTFSIELPGRLRALEDVDGDGWADALVDVDQELVWLRGLGGGNLDPTLRPTIGVTSLPMFIARDFSGDGRADALLNGPNVLASGLLMGDGTGAFEQTWVESFDLRSSISGTNVVVPLGGWSHFVLHVAGDQEQARTVVASCDLDGTVTIEQEHVGAAGFVLGAVGDEGGPYDVVLHEYAAPGQGPFPIVLLEGALDGLFTRTELEPNVEPLLTLDIDADGMQELLVHDGDELGLRHWEDDGYGPPEAIDATAVSWGPVMRLDRFHYEQREEWFDFDGDGWTDFVSTAPDDPTATHWLWHYEPCLP